MSFDDYLIAKKINARHFAQSEPGLFSQWRSEFEQMHPNSFTVQKLNLINPVRRKYPLKDVPPATVSGPAATSVPPKPGKPVMKPKPKIN